jgi:hypothetical protein
MADGPLKLPEAALAQVSGHCAVRVIVRGQDSAEAEEAAEWNTLTADECLASYSPADAICDAL